MSGYFPPTAVPTHPPAQKVAGRRLSMTSRPKPHLHSLEHKVMSGTNDDEDEDVAPVDYPRPAPPAELASGEKQHRHEDEQPKQNRKHDPTYTRKVQETLRRKADQNRPSKDHGMQASVERVNQPSRRLSM